MVGRQATLGSGQYGRRSSELRDYLSSDDVRLPKWFLESSVECDLTLGRGYVTKHAKNRALRIAVRRASETDYRIVLDSTFHDALTTADPFPVLERLHEEATSSFEELITERVRGIMIPLPNG
jgi:hypothetical protein